MGQREVCGKPDANGLSRCARACEDVDDCLGGGADMAAQDHDNYECDEGACVYIGCNEDEECSVQHGAGYICAGGD